MQLPWEFLYDDDRPNFLALRLDAPVVRHLDLPRRRRPMRVLGPLRILGMVSSPSDYTHLDSEKEIRVIETALKRLTERGLVELEWTAVATLRELQIRPGQRERPFHVFHYIGHGEYDSQGKNGELVLEDRQGRPQKVTGAELGTILCDHRSMRVAVLNACEGARTSAIDPFAGVATSLVEREIPTVIAIQFEITDGAAIIFAEEFTAPV
jgi:CHAT domain-containing protein